MAPDGDGVLILDYKTDRPRNQTDFEQRCELYAWQMRLYAAALTAIENRPVRRAVLVFLGRRELVEVDARPLLQTLVEGVLTRATTR